MKLYGAGNAILHYRLKNELSQSQVCEGICLEMTLSRIETGEREFDSLISETLLGRLGKTTNRFEFLLNDEDYYYYRLREGIVTARKEQDFSQAKELIEEYKKNMPDVHELHKQFVLLQEALLMKAEGRSEEEIVGKLYEAINLTRGDFREPASKLRLFSPIEIQLIYELFMYEEYTFVELSSMFRFVDELYEESEKGKLMIPFMTRIAKRYENECNWYELYKITNKGIEFLVNGRFYPHLTEFHYWNMESEYHMSKNTDDWERKVSALIEKCNAIYYMSMTLEDEDMMMLAERFCEEKLGCQITK